MTPAPRTLLEKLYSRWTVSGPTLDPDGSGAFIIEIKELPGFVVAAETKDEAIHQFTPALRVHLQAYLDAKRDIPVPNGPAGWTPAITKPILGTEKGTLSILPGITFAHS